MELLNGDNQYQCDMCQKKTDANKGIKLQQLPPILTISLNRFRCGKGGESSDLGCVLTAILSSQLRLDERPPSQGDGQIHISHEARHETVLHGGRRHRRCGWKGTIFVS